MELKAENFKGVWSAMSTPLTCDGKVDEAALAKLIEHEVKLNVSGLFIAGTAGEGPVLSDSERLKLAQLTVKYVAGRMPVAMQITDNSAQRMIEKLPAIEATGVDIAVIAPPFFCLGNKQDYLLKLYTEVINACNIPVGIYNLGKNNKTFVAPETMAEILKNPKVVLVKDSSGSDDFMPVILDAVKSRGGSLYALCGDEFNGLKYIQAGYDGLLWGGGCFNALYGQEIIDLALAGKIEEAIKVQDRLVDTLFKVFGGKDIKCWLAGQKELMVRLGIFNTNTNLYGYTVTEECSKAIDEVLQTEKEYLLP